MTTTPTTISIDPKIDLIIEFSIKTKNKKEEIELKEEYKNLINLLNEIELNSTSRLGNKNSDTLLIFIKASEIKLKNELIKERRSDWLHGIGTKPIATDLLNEPMTSSERIRLVYSILTSSSKTTTKTTTSTLDSSSAPPLSLVPNCPQFPRVLSIFPPHDPKFNRNWMKLWSSRTHVLSIPSSELTMLKDHFGSTIALYFAFLKFYFSSLAVPTIFGLIFWLYNIKYSPLYSVGILLWSLIFVESWRIKEKELGVEWGTYGSSGAISSVEAIRPQFHGNKKELDPVTNEMKPSFPWYQTLIRQLSNIPIVVIFAAALAVMLSIVYAIETVVGEVYVGPGKRLLALVPTILLSGLIPQFTKLWEVVARRLTTYENHKHNSNYQNSLTLKVFALNFLLAYGALLLTSYVYIPFGGILVPHILTLLPKHESLQALRSLPSGTFSINSSKLHTQVIAFTLTGQIIGAFTENVVPILLRVLNREVANIQEKRKSGSGSEGIPQGQDEEDEKVFLERIRFESTLPEYNGFADYAELAIQLGYLVMFSLIWPAAPFFSFINNFFELRSDAFKLASQSRRPIPTRSVSIGPWLEVLGFITWSGSLTNASLVYLYQPHYISTSTENSLAKNLLNSTISLLSNSTSLTSTPATEKCVTYTNLRLATLNSSSLKDPQSYLNIKSTLFTALLIALASEHTFLLVKEGIKYLLIRSVWRGSKADNIIRIRELELKRGYLEGREEEEDKEKKFENEKTTEVEIAEDSSEIFWKRGDIGREEINRRSKSD